MISKALSRFSREHPGSALTLTLVILLGATAALVAISIRDLRHGELLRPVGLLAVLIVISIRQAATGLKNKGKS